jgi:hypothetical protein
MAVQPRKPVGRRSAAAANSSTLREVVNNPYRFQIADSVLAVGGGFTVVPRLRIAGSGASG